MAAGHRVNRLGLSFFLLDQLKASLHAGFCVLFIQGFSNASALTQVQQCAETCCQGIAGINFVYATQLLGVQGQRVGVVSLKVTAALAFASRHPERYISGTLGKLAGYALYWSEVTVSQAGCEAHLSPGASIPTLCQKPCCPAFVA